MRVEYTELIRSLKAQVVTLQRRLEEADQADLDNWPSLKLAD